VPQEFPSRLYASEFTEIRLIACTEHYENSTYAYSRVRINKIKIKLLRLTTNHTHGDYGLLDRLFAFRSLLDSFSSDDLTLGFIVFADRIYEINYEMPPSTSNRVKCARDRKATTHLGNLDTSKTKTYEMHVRSDFKIYTYLQI